MSVNSNLFSARFKIFNLYTELRNRNLPLQWDGLLRWMRDLRYCLKAEHRTIFVPSPTILLATAAEMDDLDREELQKKIIKLERQLLETQLKAEGYGFYYTIQLFFS